MCVCVSVCVCMCVFVCVCEVGMLPFPHPRMGVGVDATYHGGWGREMFGENRELCKFNVSRVTKYYRLQDHNYCRTRKNYGEK